YENRNTLVKKIPRIRAATLIASSSFEICLAEGVRLRPKPRPEVSRLRLRANARIKTRRRTIGAADDSHCEQAAPEQTGAPWATSSAERTSDICRHDPPGCPGSGPSYRRRDSGRRAPRPA